MSRGELAAFRSAKFARGYFARMVPGTISACIIFAYGPQFEGFKGDLQVRTCMHGCGADSAKCDPEEVFCTRIHRSATQQTIFAYTL